MKKYLMVILTLAALIALAESTPTVVAIVNGYEITSDFLNVMADLNRILLGIHDLDRRFFDALTNTKEGLVFLQRYRLVVLNDLIDQLLTQQLAEREGVAPKGEDVKKAVERDLKEAVERLGMKMDDFERYLGKIGMSIEELREKLEWMYRTNMSLENLKEKITKDATVSEEEIRAEYERIKEKVQVHTLVMFLDSEEKAKEAMEKLSEGIPFTEVASEMSIQLGSISKNGDLGWMDEDAISAVFGEDYAKRIFKASKGAILGPYEMGKVWVIFMVADKKVERLDYEKVKGEIERRLLEEKREKIWNEWWKKNFEEFKKESEIKILIGGEEG